ncbi:MAG: cupin domain-containing protein [Kiritimatiellia bacterium]
MKNIACYAIGFLVLVSSLAQAGEEIKIINVLENIPYGDEGMMRRELVAENHLLMMQVALKPGQAVPHHNANSNVHLLIVKGEVVVTLDGKEIVAREGALVPIAFKTPMSIANKSKENASFLIIKTPNPTQMTEQAGQK